MCKDVHCIDGPLKNAKIALSLSRIVTIIIPPTPAKALNGFTNKKNYFNFNFFYFCYVVYLYKSLFIVIQYGCRDCMRRQCE